MGVRFMMRQREETIKVWFDMWLGDDITPMNAIFTDDVEYTECWGNQYFGKKEIDQWFEDWHKNNRMSVWKVKQFMHTEDKTIVEFHMEALAMNGTTRWLEGVYIIEWDENERIKALREYGANSRTIRPYGE